MTPDLFNSKVISISHDRQSKTIACTSEYGDIKVYSYPQIINEKSETISSSDNQRSDLIQRQNLVLMKEISSAKLEEAVCAILVTTEPKPPFLTKQASIHVRSEQDCNLGKSDGSINTLAKMYQQNESQTKVE